ncbi:DNA alkylation repair protein [Ligilactobacillus sp. LYQ135]
MTLRYETFKMMFEKNSNLADRIAMKKYMRNQFEFYGIKTPKRKEIYREFLKEECKLKQIDWEFLDECYADEHREFQYLVCNYLERMQNFIETKDIAHIQKFIQTKSWWDTVDSFNKVIGKLTLRDEEVKQLMRKWAVDEDFWLRRIAIIHQITFKEQTNSELLQEVILANLGSGEFFINKAIGWALRDYSKTNPQWVRNFISKNQSKLSKLSVREGSKYI